MAVEPVAPAEPGPVRGPHRGSGHAHSHGQSQSAGPASQLGMRRQNLALVMGSVAAHGPLSRAEVAERTGLTRAAVGSLASELTAAGLINDHGIAPRGRVGRPGAMLAVSGTGPAGLGLEVGVGHLAACLVDLRGATRSALRVETDNRGRDPATVLGELTRVAEQVMHEGAATGLRPVGAVLAVPGLVGDQSRHGSAGTGGIGGIGGTEPGLVERAPNLDWHKTPAAALLRDRLPVPLRAIPLRVDNEANLGALAELWDGTSVGADDFVHVSAEAGIGAAIVVGGRLLRGVHGFAGELGHVPVHPDGPPCACGARGCLEQYAGEEAVLRAAGWPSGPGDPVEVLAERAVVADARVCTALEQAGGALGTALAGAVNLLDPAAVILGGAYADLGTWLLPAMRRELAARVTVRPWSADALVVSRLGRRGPLLGAAMSTVRQIIEDPWLFARGSG
jgi:predicted NBD/HSP70 family sugar kinase